MLVKTRSVVSAVFMLGVLILLPERHEAGTTHLPPIHCINAGLLMDLLITYQSQMERREFVMVMSYR